MKDGFKKINLFARLEQIYGHDDLSLLGKVRTLATSNWVFSVLTILGFLGSMNFDENRSDTMLTLAVTVVVCVMYVISLFLLHSKHFKIASYFNSMALSLYLYYLAIQRYNPELSLVEGTLYNICIGLAIGLYGVSVKQFISALIMHYFYIGIYCYIFMYPLVVDKGEFMNQTLATLASLHAVYIMLVVNYMNSNKVYYEIRNKAKEVEQNNDKIKELFLSAQKGLEIGEKVQQVANNSYVFTKQIDSVIDRMNGGIKNLLSILDLNQNEQSQLGKATASIKASMEVQTTAITQTSAAVLEMTASVRQMTGITQEKKVIMDNLISISNSGARRIEDTVGSIARIVNSSQKLLDVLDVIDGISSRTNLLAMNAAIEAAHAGEAGRGFSIVAEEIRKLAEETSSNSNVIKQTLEENITQVQETSGINEETVAVFETMNKKILDFGQALNEIFMGMSEITNVTDEILASIENIRSGNDNVFTTMLQIDNSVVSSNKGINDVRTVTDGISDGMSDIVKVAGKIVEVSEEILDLGGENLKQITRLRQGILEK